MRVILFNLTPYRERREALQRQLFLGESMLVLLGALLLCWSVNSVLDEKVNAKQAYLDRIHALQQTVADRVAEVDGIKKKLTTLQRQVSVLKSIESDSRFSSELLSVIDQSIPQGMALKRIVVSRDKVFLIGRTDNVNTLARWVAYLKRFPKVYSDASLISVTLAQDTKTNDKGIAPADALHDFELQLKVAAPSLDLGQPAEDGSDRT